MATATQQAGFKRVKRGYKPLSVDNLVPLYEIKNLMNPANKDPTDPFFKYQWYLKNVGQNGGKPKLDLNVEAAWAQGVTGKNVTTAIMDDGTSGKPFRSVPSSSSFFFSDESKFPSRGLFQRQNS